LIGTFININQLPDGKYLFDAVWSLSVEFQFYTFVTLVSSILVYILNKNKQEIETFFLQIFTFIYLISNLIRVFNLFYKTNIPFFSYIITWEFDFLFIGFILSILERKGWISKFICISREAALFISPLLITIPLGLVAVSESKLSIDKVILQGFTLPIISICFTFLVFISATIGSFPGSQTRLYIFLYWIGDRSYSIYLLHFPVMAFSWILIYKFCPFLFSNAILYGVAQALITISLLIPLVEVVYLKIEMPCIEYSQKGLFVKR
jgi:peptidoglycan/LPS O-acetylase OafA/YrhL